MADRYVRATGGNWNNAATWELTPSGGEAVAVPVAADDVYLVAGSGQLTINATAFCRSFDCDGYANTLTHNAVNLSVGTTTARVDLVALRLAGTYNAIANTATITYASSAEGVHKVYLGGKTVGTQYFSSVASYQMQDDWTMHPTAPATFSFSNGTLDTNGKTMTNGLFSINGANVKTISFGNSTINLTGTTNAFLALTSNLTIAPNTAKIVINKNNHDFRSSGFDWNGLSLITTGANGTCSIFGSNVFKDIICTSTAGKTISFQANTITTITGNLYVYGSGVNLITLRGSSITNPAAIYKESGVVNVYGSSVLYLSATGGATFNASKYAGESTVSLNSGWNYVHGLTYYMDMVNGNDTSNTPLGWWSVAYTGATGSPPAIDETVSGAISGSTAVITHVNLYEWSIGVGTLYFYGKSAPFVAETINCSGGGSCAIAGDFTYCAWKTFATGATAARIMPGDTIRVAKSPSPTSSGVTSTWTDGPLPDTKNIVSSTNTNPIVVRVTGHGYVTNDVVQIVGHTVNTKANGAWIVTRVDDDYFSLNNSVGNGVGGASGTSCNINNKTVRLSSSLNDTIQECDENWTPGVGVTSAKVDTSVFKEGYGSVKIITAAGHAGAGIIAKYGLASSIDLSGKQQISFWLRNETSALANAGDLKIRLYSDVACTILQDSFDVPAINSTVNWLPITIDKGSALSATVQGIAVYANIAMASKIIYVDNFIACNTSSDDNGLTLQSLISQSSADQGGEDIEGWYGIQSIKGTLILLDNANVTIGSAGRGWSGTTAIDVAIYKRETIKTTLLGTTDLSIINLCSEGGLPLVPSYIAYEGGYSPDTNTQIGETYLDGLNGKGVGLAYASWTSLNYFSFCRYGYGLYAAGAVGFHLKNLTNCNNNNAAVSFNSGRYCVANLIVNANNNGTTTISNRGVMVRVEKICNLSNNLGTGFEFYAAHNGWVGTIEKINNSPTTGVYFNYSGDCFVDNVAMFDLVIPFYVSNGQGNYIRLASSVLPANPLTMASTYTYGNGRLSIGTLINGATTYSNYTLTDYGLIVSDSVETHSGTGLSWKMSPLHAARNINSPVVYPLDLAIARIAVEAGSPVIVSAWFNKTHATDIGARLVCRGGQISGVPTDVYVEATNTTGWQLLTLPSFTPSSDGVIEIEAWAYWIANEAIYSVYVDDFSASQA